MARAELAWELIYKQGTTLKEDNPPKLYLGPLTLLSLDSPSLTPPCYTMTASILHILDCPRAQLVIHTDSHNAVNIWNALKASKDYNDLLHTAIVSMLLNSLDVQVLYVPSSENLVADFLLWAITPMHNTLCWTSSSAPFNLLMMCWGQQKKIVQVSTMSRQPPQEAWTID